MQDIDQLIGEVITREGGFVDHPADKGGPTRYGITEAVARENGYKGTMAALPRDLAAAIYRKLYWTLPGFDLVARRAPMIAAELFDTGVNMGPAVAAGFLQRALNGLNRSGADYPDLVQDGRIGPTTLTALDGFRRARGAAGEQVLLKALESLQGERYIALAERRPANEAFLYGWLANRIGLLVAVFCLMLLPVGGCTTATSYSKARTAVDVADAAFARVQVRAIEILPLLPAPAAARVRAGLAIADLALAAAQGAVDPADREQQLRRAAGAIADVVEASRQR